MYTNLLAVLQLFLLHITHYGFLSTSQQPASLPLSMSSLSCYHLHHHSLTCHVKFLILSIAILPSLILTRYQHAAHACCKLEYAISPQALLSCCGTLVNFRRKVFPTHWDKKMSTLKCQGSDKDSWKFYFKHSSEVNCQQMTLLFMRALEHLVFNE